MGNTLRGFRLTAMILLAISLTVPILAMSAAEASAAPVNGANCEVGELVDGSCVIDLGPPTCPDDFVLDDGVCISITEPETVLICPPGAQGEPGGLGGCFMLVPKDPAICDPGFPVDNSCIVDEPAPVGCPDGFEADGSLGGMCARFEPAEQNPASCPEGAHGEAGGCYILVARGPGGFFCPEGELIGQSCVIEGPPPVAGEGTCPLSPNVFEVEDRCFSLVSEVDGECPVDTIPAANPGLCERSVELVPGALICADGFGIIDGICVRYVDPLPTAAECPTGSVEDANGDCRKPVADAAGSFFCADETAALNGQSCVFTAGFVFGPCPGAGELVGDRCISEFEPIAPPQCPVGSVEDISGLCLAMVDGVPSEPFCLEQAVLTPAGCELTAPPICDGGELVDGLCIDEVPPIFLCDGRAVTINMQLGDPGIGTDGDDVILGTDGADLIRAKKGHDTICAQGGNDVVHGGRGADVIFGEGGQDTIKGGRGADVISGGDDADVLRAGPGHDQVFGDGGDDKLHGGRGEDLLNGGADIDTCKDLHGPGTPTTTVLCEIQILLP